MHTGLPLPCTIHSFIHSLHPPPHPSSQARIDKVHVDGVGRTKDDLVQATVQPMFEAATLEDVITRTHEARTRLEQLGCFRSVGVFIDTSRGPDATEKGLEVSDGYSGSYGGVDSPYICRWYV